MVELRLLGPIEVADSNGRPVDSLTRQPKRLALLAYLAVASSRALYRRDKLVALFWPELDTGHARNALSQALYVIRTALGGDVIVTHGDEEIGIARNVLWTDVAAFDAALLTQKPDQALILYRGDLLDGFFVSGAPDFEQWLDGERERLRQRAAAAAVALAEEIASKGNSADAARWALRASEIAPSDESQVRRLMALLHRLGDRAAALRVYEALVTRLQRELDLAPSPETRAVADGIRVFDGSAPGTVAPVRLTSIVHSEPLTLVRRPVIAWLTAAAFLALTSAFLLETAYRRGNAQAVMRFALDVSRTRPLAGGIGGSTLALSPDGSRLVYIGTGERGTQFFLRPLERLDATPLEHTVGARHPFFSPDGQWVAFELNGTLQKVRLDGGPPVTICEVGKIVRGASWGSDDVIVFATERALWRVSARGGAPAILTGGDTVRGTFEWPEVLPSGNVLLTITTSSGMWLASASAETGTIRFLGVEGSNPHFIPPNHLVFARMDGTLLAAPFDAAKVEITGSAIPLADAVAVGNAGAAKVAVSRSGAVVYLREFGARSLVRVDRLGNESVVQGGPRRFGVPRLSRDGKRIAVEVKFAGPSRGDLWVIDLERSTFARITTDSGSMSPVWSPNGERVTYATMTPRAQAGFAVRQVRTDGLASSEELLPPHEGQFPQDVTPDGRMLLIGRRDATTGRDLWIVPLHDKGDARPYIVAEGDQYAASISPNGRWVAYVANESGRDEVYVNSFPTHAVPRLVSLGGGREPRWSRSGTELFYRGANGMVAVSVTNGPVLRVGQRRLLFDDRRYIVGQVAITYDVDPDGRFLMVQRGTTGAELVALLNWFTAKHSPGKPNEATASNRQESP